MNQRSTQRSAQHATFVIERTYDAAPARVFGAWADPAAKARWFGPSESGARSLDFQVGGCERFTAGGSDGALFVYDAQYQEIVPQQRIVYVFTLDRDETRISASLATVEFEPAAAGTCLRYTEQAVYLDGGDTPAAREHGTRAYLIAFGGLLLLAGRLGDMVGRKSIFMVGLGVFTTASLLCGLAQSQALLVAARFVQGVGGAMTSAVILGMIVTMFPEPRAQAKAIGVYGFVASAGGSVGLLAGGVLTQSINWHWIFFVNVPIGIATAILAVRLLDRDKGIGFAAGADAPGAVLITSSLMLGVYTIVKPAADYGWGAGRTLALAGVSLALLVAFVVREVTARNPLMPLRIFRSRNVSGANIVQALLVAGMFGMFFLGALYLQRVLGYDALQIGLAFLPATIVMGTLSLRYSERLIMNFGPKTTLLPGLVFVAAGLLLFARAPVHGSYLADVFPVMILLGCGVGGSFPALMTLAMSGATPKDAGLASGLVNTAAQVGGALGLAVLATLSATRTAHLHAGGASQAAALTGGYHLAFIIGAGLMLLAVLVAATALRSEARPGEHPAAAEQAGHEPAAYEQAPHGAAAPVYSEVS